MFAAESGQEIIVRLQLGEDFLNLMVSSSKRFAMADVRVYFDALSDFHRESPS